MVKEYLINIFFAGYILKYLVSFEEMKKSIILVYIHLNCKYSLDFFFFNQITLKKLVYQKIQL